MVKIYINNILQKTEILPSNTPTKDETLETFSFALISNTTPLPYASGQQVKVDFSGDGTDVAYFFLVSDSVETCSLKPLRYKHNISCTQNTRKLSKHMVRNSSFTQPFYLFKNSFNTEKRYLKNQSSGGVNEWRGEFGEYNPGDSGGDQTYYDELNYNSKKLELLENEKVTNASFKLSFQYGISSNNVSTNGHLYAYDHNAADIMTRLPGMEYSMEQHFTLKYTNINGTTITKSLTPLDFGESGFDFNKTYNFPLIVELAKQGCNNFEILFDTLDMLNGRFIASTNAVQWWMIQVQINVTVYYYNCYDILELLINRQKKQTTLRSEPQLFILPQSGELYDLLKNTIAPNFTFTDLTMYECVAEVFRVFDAIFTMDQYGVLGIEFFNDLSGEDITAKAKFTGRTLALGEDKYTNGLVANYQDAHTIETFPREEGKTAHLRSAEFGAPEPQDHNFIVPHNIDNILKCEIVIDGFDFKYYVDAGHDVGVFYGGEMTIDITRYVLEQNVWSLLEEGDMLNSDYVSGKMKKTNCIYYTKGDNKIQCGFSFKSTWQFTKYVLQALVDTELVHLAAMHSHDRICLKDYGTNQTILRGDWKEIRMRAIYITTIDGKTKVHSLVNKYPGETIIDQANGAVDLNKFGLNMLGLSLKLGNPTLNATHRISKWSDRIRIGQLYNWQGSLWVANVVNYTFMGGRVQGKVSFVQNFNSLALRTQLLREKRMSNISRELVQKSEEVLTDFAYFSTIDPITLNKYGEKIHFDNDSFWYILGDSLDGGTTPGFKVGDAFLEKGHNDPLELVNCVYIPLVKYGAGNTINFEMSYDHPMNAGNSTRYSDGHYFTNHTIYTNDDGFLENATIYFPKNPPTYGQDFPMVAISDEDINENVIEIKNFKVYKQPNEILALNYQVAFLPLPGRENIDFLGNEFINNNHFVKDNESNQTKRYIALKSEKSSNLDIKATPYFAKKQITDFLRYRYQDDSYKFAMRFTFDAITQEEMQQVISWAIIDERDNVLFASNEPLEHNTYLFVYFVTKLARFN